MSGYDLFVAPINREVIDAKAWAFRYAFGADDAYAPDIARILEHEVPKILSGFALRVLSREAMPADEARTHHTVPAIDIREDIYERLCDWDGRARMTGAHELGHLLLHHGESRPRAVVEIKAKSIPRNRSSERQADDFAASFLMPQSIVRQFDNPAELAEHCKVTPRAAEVRMRELGLWPKGRPLPKEVEEFLASMKELQKRQKRDW
jgi:IrrE N-terminal-like domain